MQTKTNFLKLTAWILLISGIIFLIPSWGGTIFLIGISIIIFLLNLIFRNYSIRFKNYTAIIIWIIFGLIIHQLTKKIILHTKGTPQNIYIVTGIENKPKIHSWWKWKNNIMVDSTYVIYTSTNGNQISLDNVKIYDENGKNIGNRGAGRDLSYCGAKRALLNFQTIYLFSEPKDNIEIQRGMKLREMQQKRCKNGS